MVTVQQRLRDVLPPFGDLAVHGHFSISCFGVSQQPHLLQDQGVGNWVAQIPSARDRARIADLAILATGPVTGTNRLTRKSKRGERQAKEENKAENLQDEVLQFPTNCPECNAPAATNMKVTSKNLLIQPYVQLRKIFPPFSHIYYIRKI